MMVVRYLTTINYQIDLKKIFNQKGIFFKLINQENKGKRAALVKAYDALGLKESPENIIFTIDSDTTLDKKLFLKELFLSR